MRDGTILNEIMNDELFITSLKNSAEFLFNHNDSIVLYDRNNVILKGLIHKSEKDKAYFIVKNSDKYSIYESIIYSYIKDKHKDTKSILSHTFCYNGIDQNVDLTFYGVNKILYWDKDPEVNLELLHYMKNNKDSLSKEEIKELMSLTFNKGYSLKITSALFALSEYCSAANSFGFDFGVTEEQFISYTKKSCEKYKTKIKDIIFRYKFIKSLDQYTENNQFEYNDLDNHIWNQDGFVILDDQNMVYICDYKDDYNVTVYFIIKDALPDEVEDIETYIPIVLEKIKNNNISIVDDCSLVYKNSEITYICTDLNYGFELDIVYGISAIEEELDVSYMSCSDVDVDINSVKYMRDYCYTLYGYNRYRFCNHVFLTLGSGYRYNSESGTYIDSSCQYIENLKTCPLEPNEEEGFLYGLYNDYTKISKLSDDWKSELKWFYEYLIKLDNSGAETDVLCKDQNNEISIKQVINSIKPFVT